MRTRIATPILFAAAVLTVACGEASTTSPAEAQSAPPSQARAVSDTMHAGPLQRLLEKRAELNLTDEQANRLTAIARELET
ncbi:hypothetical protein BH23GEM4_BH23GEM4_15560 [soil metagenome]